ncbi:hypothetical protein AB4Y45_33305 [Paraburkholderia sp. EG287A]|uniref:hypothetical protein n=1 Tax=Paraburkholderia sp. EG287A TaxID=3237012 RepID=UPI0034D251B1
MATTKEIAAAVKAAARKRVPSKKGSSPHGRRWLSFLEAQGGQPFRRQDFAEVVYQNIRPRKMDTAREIADFYMERARSAGEIVKAGHVHWKQLMTNQRKLLSGRTVADAPDLCELKLTTRCPSKWVAVDLETGDVYGSDITGSGWKRATYDAAAEAATILSGAADKANEELRAQVAQLTKERDLFLEGVNLVSSIALEELSQ